LFLTSLASYADGRGIAVILSGSGTDGVLGIRQVKAAGGIVLVQDPESARFDGMPRSAIATGLADFTGSPEELAEELTRIARCPKTFRSECISNSTTRSSATSSGRLPAIKTWNLVNIGLRTIPGDNQPPALAH
jgi:hypothetical protein